MLVTMLLSYVGFRLHTIFVCQDSRGVRLPFLLTPKTLCCGQETCPTTRSFIEMPSIMMSWCCEALQLVVVHYSTTRAEKNLASRCHLRIIAKSCSLNQALVCCFRFAVRVCDLVKSVFLCMFINDNLYVMLVFMPIQFRYDYM